MFILGFRPGSVVVDFRMKVGETKENEKIEKENLVEILKVVIEENRDETIFEADSVTIEGEKGSRSKVVGTEMGREMGGKGAHTYTHTGAE